MLIVNFRQLPSSIHGTDAVTCFAQHRQQSLVAAEVDGIEGDESAAVAQIGLQALCPCTVPLCIHLIIGIRDRGLVVGSCHLISHLCQPPHAVHLQQHFLLLHHPLG